MAQVPGAEWDSVKRCWFAPLDSIGAVLERYPQAKYDDNIWRALGPEKLAALQAERAAKHREAIGEHHG